MEKMSEEIVESCSMEDLFNIHSTLNSGESTNLLLSEITYNPVIKNFHCLPKKNKNC